MRNKEIFTALFLLLAQLQPAYATREGWDVLNGSIKVPGCTSSEASGPGIRPGYIVNADYGLLSKSNRVRLYFHITSNSNAYLERVPRDQNNENYPGWVALSLVETKRMWGKSHINKAGNCEYITFDVFAQTINGDTPEKNLYHIDIRSNDNTNVSAYRIRGMALTNADWIYPETSIANLR